MSRSDDDTWDITESVGATALGVAAARAAESESAEPLIEDPFARVFLDAAGDGIWNMFAPSALPAELVEAEPDIALRMHMMVDYMASRTAFFDSFFTTAAEAGVRQAVILASGLDSRAWRLPWPDGMVVYELDQPKVLEFKATTLRRHGATPTAREVDVAVDLRHDWPKALREAGFDASASTVWSAEGLLPFLPGTAQDLLFERVHELSATGSRIAVEAFSPGFLTPEIRERQQSLMQRFVAAAAQKGVSMPNVGDLWYDDDRADVATWLRDRGWEVSSITAEDLTARYGRSLPEGLDKDAAMRSVFVTGIKSAAGTA